MGSDFNHFGIDEWVAQEEARRREAEAAGRLESLRGGVRFLWGLRSTILRVHGRSVGRH
jgi:hypothetical protein